MPAETPAPAPTSLEVTGMSCSNCARHVTEALQAVPGVASASVQLEKQRASVRWLPTAAPRTNDLIQAVEKAGYAARAISPANGHTHAHGQAEAEEHSCHGEAAEDHGTHGTGGWQANLWVGVLVTGPLLLGEWVFGFGAQRWFHWASFALAAVVQFYAGAQFYKGAWRQLRVGQSNMDALVALGSTTAFGYSVWALLTGATGHLYFAEAAAIITLVSLGHWLEARVSARASSALRHLLELAPSRARKRNADGTEIEVAVGELEIGDLVALRPGDRVPTDGVVVEGQSGVNEAMLTGESAPVAKESGSLVYAGTVALEGRLLLRVTATGEGTALAAIVAAVQRAQTSRANIQRLGDRVSSVFVPVVVAIALAAALWWGLAPGAASSTHAALAHWLWTVHAPTGAAAPFVIAAAVLIIACPCAMGLATPAAIMAGANAAARRGILIRDGVALEKAGLVTAILFDKTGTLTTGELRVAREWKAPGIGVDATALAASLARNSSHPASQAIARLAATNGSVALKDWREVPGHGVQASGAADLLRLGSLRWLTESGVDATAGDEFIREWSGRGASLVGLAEGARLLGLFAIQDTLKSGAPGVVAELGRLGHAVYMITGDHPLTAASVAAQAGIPADRVFAGVRPEEKAGFIEKLQREGRSVAFVGDGINDAPALARADLGIAVSRAADVAREAADIILLNSEIEAVPECLALARATLRTIKQNLFWAFFYNAAGVPLAALGFMSPILCAAAMGLSDMVVIGNALRLGKRAFR